MTEDEFKVVQKANELVKNANDVFAKMIKERKGLYRTIFLLTVVLVLSLLLLLKQYWQS